MLSLVPSHALVDGNERLARFGVVAFYEPKGRSARVVDDMPFETNMAIARGEIVDVPVLAAILRTRTTPWRCRHPAATAAHVQADLRRWARRQK